MKTLLKAAAVFLAVIAIAALYFAAIYADSRRGRVSAEQVELAELQSKRVELTKEKQELENSLEKEHKGTGHMILLFTQTDERVYTEAFPAASDIPCSLLLTPDNLPDSDTKGTTAAADNKDGKKPSAKLSWEQIKELSGAGWGICLGWDGSAEIKEWHEQMQKALADAGMPVCTAVYLNGTKYKEENGKRFSELGYKTVIHHGEANGNDLSCTAVENSLWLPGAIGWNAQNTSTMPKTLAADGGSLVFTIGYDNTDEMYEAERFTSLIAKLKEYRDAEELFACTPDSAYEYYEKLTAENKEIAAGYDAADAIQEQIDEVNERIDDIYADAE